MLIFIEKQTKINDFTASRRLLRVPLGGLLKILEGVLEALGGVLEGLEGVLEASWRLLKALEGVLEALGGVLEAMLSQDKPR